MANHFFTLGKFKDITLSPASIKTAICHTPDPQVFDIELSSASLSPFVCLQTRVPGKFDDNAFMLIAGKPRRIRFISDAPSRVEAITKSLEVIDLYSTYL